MTQKEIFDIVVRLVEPYAKNVQALKAASEKTNLLEDLDISSARLVDLILAFEDEFSISITDENADSINTIGDVVELIDRLQKK